MRKMIEVLSMYNLKNLIKEQICFKDTGTLFWHDSTKCTKNSQKSKVFETGLSGFSELIVTVIQ